MIYNIKVFEKFLNKLLASPCNKTNLSINDKNHRSFLYTTALPGIEPGKKQTIKDEIWSWLSDLTGLENNENSNICACGKWLYWMCMSCSDVI